MPLSVTYLALSISQAAGLYYKVWFMEHTNSANPFPLQKTADLQWSAGYTGLYLTHQHSSAREPISHSSNNMYKKYAHSKSAVRECTVAGNKLHLIHCTSDYSLAHLLCETDGSVEL